MADATQYTVSPLTTAVSYINRGWAPIPIPRRNAGKNPGFDGWLTDIDLDCPEVLRAAALILPPTAAKFGRASTPNSHWLYRTDLCGRLGKARLAL